MKWTITASGINRVTHAAAGKQANGTELDNVIEAISTRHINGSGPHAFGGAKDWPAATMRVSFQVGEDDKRDRFIAEFKQLCERFFT